MPASRVERVEGVKWRRWTNASCCVAVIQTGVGLAKAQAACQAVLDKRPWTVFIASGFAGALVPSQIGDLVIPEQVVCRDLNSTGSFLNPSIFCNSFYRQKAQNTAKLSENTILSGRLVTVWNIVWLAQDKQAIGRAFEASSLDMESAAIGTSAAQHGIPFFVVRSVSDRVEEDLPLDLNLFCQPGTFLQGVWAVAKTPGIWPALNRLRRQKNVASAQLTRFFENFFSIARDNT